MDILRNRLMEELGETQKGWCYLVHTLDDGIVVDIDITETIYRSLAARCFVPLHYPTSQITVDLESTVIPSFCLEKLLKICNEEIKKVEVGKPHVLHIGKLLKSILQNSKLLLCANDVEEIKSSLLTGAKDLLTVSDKKGNISIYVEDDGFFADFVLKVSIEYPSAPLSLECRKTNVLQSINNIFMAQATELASRCSEGKVRRERMQNNTSTATHTGEPKPMLSVHQYRDDVKFLKERSVYAAAAVDRRSRRELARFEKRESDREIELMKKHEEINPSGKDVTAAVARPGLIPVATFLICDYIRALSRTTCGYCEKYMKENFRIGAATEAERSQCGHWFHSHCLQQVMKTPPFGKQCPAKGCTSSVVSSKWNSTSEINEQRWATEQAHKRELQEIRDFLDF